MVSEAHSADDLTTPEHETPDTWRGVGGLVTSQDFDL
jgi:hypothetical protein